MATLNSFGLSFCCILYLLLTSSNGSIYNNEICFSENWMPIVIGGSSWSWTTDSNSCSLTSDMNTHNMAMLAYKSWPYLNNAQDPSYTLEIEYNFTITAASANNTIGSVGILWFSNTQTVDYIGVSFKQNEAFAAYISDIQKGFVYNNMYTSWDGGQVVELNGGALPFTLSVGAFYSMRVEVYGILDDRVLYHIYINGKSVNSNGFKTYSTAFDQNTSWLGLKNTDTAVISHALTVYQTSNIDDGNVVMQYFESSNDVTTTTGIIETTDHSTTTDVFTTNIQSPKVSDQSNVKDQLFGMDMNLILLVIGVTVGGYLVCCCVWILILRYLPKKKTKVDVTMISPRNKSEYMQPEGEGDMENEAPGINNSGFWSNTTSYDTGNVIIPTSAGGSDHLKPMIEHDSIALERMCTNLCSEGVQRGVFCTKCHTKIQDGSVYMNNGMKYCNDCYGNLENDLEDKARQERLKTTKTLQTKTKKTPFTKTKKTPKGDQRDKCTDCGGKKQGKISEEDGLFYCNKCWENYENDEELFINKSDDNTVSGTNNYIQ
eukprot:490478_1